MPPKKKTTAPPPPPPAPPSSSPIPAPKSKARLKAEAKELTDTRTQVVQWIHQHTIEAISLCPFHRGVLQRLRQEPIDTLPNLLFYGSTGFPLEYMAYALLGQGDNAAAGSGPGPSKKECVWNDKVPYGECEAFFEIQCRHPDLTKDYGVLCDFLKAILQTRPIFQTKHVFILRDIDIIAQSDHHYALRVLLERYSANVLFIATTHALSKLEPPLRSRFMMVRIPQPTPDDKARFSQHFGAAEGAVAAGVANATTFIEAMYLLRLPPPPESQVLTEFLSQGLSASPQEVRAFAYRCFHKGYTFAYFCRLLLQQIPSARLAQEFSRLEYTLTQSSKGREPLYYEKALYITLFLNSIWK